MYIKQVDCTNILILKIQCQYKHFTIHFQAYDEHQHNLSFVTIKSPRYGFPCVKSLKT